VLKSFIVTLLVSLALLVLGFLMNKSLLFTKKKCLVLFDVIILFYFLLNFADWFYLSWLSILNYHLYLILKWSLLLFVLSSHIINTLSWLIHNTIIHSASQTWLQVYKMSKTTPRLYAAYQCRSKSARPSSITHESNQ
jgi:hypothetical protein